MREQLLLNVIDVLDATVSDPATRALVLIDAYEKIRDRVPADMECGYQ